MDYSISRAHEIRRLSYENQISLKIAEKNVGRCFMPFEIQERFQLPPLKASWLIPEIEAAQASHTQRLNSEFYKEKIFPAFGYLSVLDVERVHQFDQVISDSTIDFIYLGAGQKKVKFRDQLGEE